MELLSFSVGINGAEETSVWLLLSSVCIYIYIHTYVHDGTINVTMYIYIHTYIHTWWHNQCSVTLWKSHVELYSFHTQMNQEYQRDYVHIHRDIHDGTINVMFSHIVKKVVLNYIHFTHKWTKSYEDPLVRLQWRLPKGTSWFLSVCRAWIVRITSCMKLDISFARWRYQHDSSPATFMRLYQAILFIPYRWKTWKG